MLGSIFPDLKLGSKDVGQVDYPAQEAVAREEPG